MAKYQVIPLVMHDSEAIQGQEAEGELFAADWTEKVRQIEVLRAPLGTLDVEYFSVEDESCAIFSGTCLDRTSGAG